MSSALYLHSDVNKPPLRIGLLMDEMRLLRALASVIEDINSCTFANIELIVVNKQPPDVPVSGGSKLRRYLNILRDKSKRKALLYSQYLKIDSRLARIKDDPLELMDCSGLLQGVKRIDVEPITKGFVHRFPEDALGQIRSSNLDVLIRFGFNILKGPVLQSARYGIWSFHHGDNDYYRGGPALFWEMRESSVTSGVILQVLSEQLDAGQVLSKAVFRTEPGYFVSRNRVAPYWGSADMVIQKLRELHDYGWEYVQSRMISPAPYQGKRKIYRTPTNSEMIGWLAPSIAGKAVRRLVPRPAEAIEWSVGLRRGRSIPGEGNADLKSFRWLPSPEDGYLADPFLVERAGKLWLFAEEFRYKEDKGVLSVCELNENLESGEWLVCLEKPWHLSYPHVFEHEGEMFMIPENNRSGRVELYRATDFPLSWKVEKVLFEGVFADVTAHFHDEMWWFFAPMIEPRGRGLSLLLFCADKLTGDWKWHPASPISRDVRNARSAGAVFGHNGRLFRPSQDNSVRYGHSFSFNEIVKLNAAEYEERLTHTVLPSLPGMIGAHTYSARGAVEAIDGNFIIRKPR